MKPFHTEALLVGAGAAALMAPGEDFLVGATRQGAGGERGEIHAEKGAAPAVETLAEIWMVISGEPAGGEETDLVEHPTEIDEAAGLIVVAAESGDVRHGGPASRIPARESRRNYSLP